MVRQGGMHRKPTHRDVQGGRHRSGGLTGGQRHIQPAHPSKKSMPQPALLLLEQRRTLNQTHHGRRRPRCVKPQRHGTERRGRRRQRGHRRSHWRGHLRGRRSDVGGRSGAARTNVTLRIRRRARAVGPFAFARDMPQALAAPAADGEAAGGDPVRRREAFKAKVDKFRWNTIAPRRRSRGLSPARRPRAAATAPRLPAVLHSSCPRQGRTSRSRRRSTRSSSSRPQQDRPRRGRQRRRRRLQRGRPRLSRLRRPRRSRL